MGAIEFLVEQLATNGVLHSSDIAKAKEIEKEQIIEAQRDKQKKDGSVKFKTYLLRIEQTKFDQIKAQAKEKGMSFKSYILSRYIAP
jgi:hypothetical protein